MRAAIYSKYGTPEVIQIIDVEIPSPQPNEILVKIKASSVTRADTMMRQGIPKFTRLFLGLLNRKTLLWYRIYKRNKLVQKPKS